MWELLQGFVECFGHLPMACFFSGQGHDDQQKTTHMWQDVVVDLVSKM